MDKDGQLLLEFVRPEAVIYTNLGMGAKIDGMLKQAGHGLLLDIESIIASRMAAERMIWCIERSKISPAKTLPFKRFAHPARRDCLLLHYGDGLLPV